MELAHARIEQRSRRQVIGQVLVILAGAVLVLSASMKFAAIPPIARQMAADGFGGSKLTFLAVLELFCAALFLWPRTRSLGLLLVSAYLGGAICLHVQLGEYPKSLPPAAILALAWTGILLKHPQAFWSFQRGESNLQSQAFNPRPELHASRVG